MADRSLAALDSLDQELDQQDRRGDRKQRKVEPELVVARRRAAVPADKRAIEQGEVHAGQEHEQRNDPL